MSEVKVYKGREAFLTERGVWRDSGFSSGAPDKENLENGFIALIKQSDYDRVTKELAEKDAEIMRLKEKLLTFEGMTFSDYKPK